MDYRNQFVVYFLFLFFLPPPLEGPSSTLLVSTGKVKKTTSISTPALLHCHHCSSRKADPQASATIRGWTGWFLSRASNCSRALGPFHPTMLLPQLSDVLRYPHQASQQLDLSTWKLTKSPGSWRAVAISLLPWYGCRREISWDQLEHLLFLPPCKVANLGNLKQPNKHRPDFNSKTRKQLYHSYRITEW